MMCLLSRKRSQTLISLSIDCMNLNNSGCILLQIKVIKSFTSKISSAANKFEAYPHDVSLCVVALIKLYLDKTAALRHDVDSMFFISYAPQEHWLASRKLARRVPDILLKTGIHNI